MTPLDRVLRACELAGLPFEWHGGNWGQPLVRVSHRRVPLSDEGLHALLVLRLGKLACAAIDYSLPEAPTVVFNRQGSVTSHYLCRTPIGMIRVLVDALEEET